MRIVVRTPGKSRFQLTFGENHRMTLIVRIMLGYLALQGAFLGLWATFAPHSAYESFPGFGMRWVAADGPYNHHLVSDVGGLYLALTAVTLAALLKGGHPLVQVAGLAWIVTGVPHFLYHVADKPADLSAISFTLSLIGVGLPIVLGVACILLAPAVFPGLLRRAITIEAPRRKTR